MEITAGIRRGSSRPERRRRDTNQADDTNDTSRRDLSGIRRPALILVRDKAFCIQLPSDLLCPITHIMYSEPPAHDAPASLFHVSSQKKRRSPIVLFCRHL